MELNQTESVKLKMRGHKLRRGVNWLGMLKQKGINHMGIKQGLRLLRNFYYFFFVIAM
jgi:DNA-binding protein